MKDTKNQNQRKCYGLTQQNLTGLHSVLLKQCIHFAFLVTLLHAFKCGQRKWLTFTVFYTSIFQNLQEFLKIYNPIPHIFKMKAVQQQQLIQVFSEKGSSILRYGMNNWRNILVKTRKLAWCCIQSSQTKACCLCD